MKPSSLQRIFQFVSMCTAQLLIVLLAPASFADKQPALDEILKKSIEALAPPIQYRIRVRGVETTVSQKQLPNGLLASRTEAVAPSQTIMISLGDKNYDVLPQSRVVIDKNQVLNNRKPTVIRTNELFLSFIPEIPENTVVADQKSAIVIQDGKQLYEIKTQFSTTAIENFNMMPDLLRKGVLAGTSLLVDKTTLAPVELEFVSAMGTPICKFEYVEIVRSAEISDDLFVLPSEFTVKTPTSMNEYFAIHTESWNDIKPAPKWRPTFPIYEDAELFTHNVSTTTPGLIIPNGADEKKFNEDVVSMRTAMLAENQNYGPRGPQNGSRRTLLLVNIVLVLSVVLFYMYRRSKPSKL